MAPSAFVRFNLALPSARDPLRPVHLVSRTVRLRLTEARQLGALTVLALSFPANERARLNAWCSAQELPEHRRRRDSSPCPDHPSAP